MHYKDRLLQRIEEKETFQVGFEKSIGKYEIVGTLNISELDKSNIKQKVNIANNVRFDNNVHIGYKLYEVSFKDVDFYDDETEEWSIGKTLVIVDEDSNSNGNLIYAIIRNNKLTTICFVKSYTGTEDLKEKLRVDKLQ